MQALAHLFERRRGLILACFVTLSLLAAARLPFLRFDAVVRGFFAADDAEYTRLMEVFRTFGSDDVDALLLIEADDVCTPHVVTAQRELIERVREVPGVSGVMSATDVPVFSERGLPRPLWPREDASPEVWAKAKADALAHPVVGGTLISQSAHVSAISVHLGLDDPSVEEMAPVIRALEAIASDIGSARALKIHVSGVPAVRVEIYSAMRRDQVLFLVIGATIGFSFLFFLFRSLWATAIAGGAAWFAVLWALGALAWVGEPLNLLSAALPTMVLVVAFADAVHLLADVRVSLQRGMAPGAAAVACVRHLGGACLVTSFTTAVGFASLAMTGIPLIQRFGIACAAGTLLAFCVVVLSVPLAAGSTWLGARLLPRKGGGLGAHPRILSAIDFTTRLALGRPKTIVFCAFLLTLVSASLALRLEPENSVRENLPRGGPAEAALDLVDRELGGMLSIAFLVRASEPAAASSSDRWQVLEEVEQCARQERDLSVPFSALNLVRALPGSGSMTQRGPSAIALFPEALRSRFWSDAEQSALLIARIEATGTRALLPVLERLRVGLSEIRARHPGFEIALTGTPVVAGANLNRMIGDLATSLGWAALVIFLAMSAAFRSWRLGLISVVPNALPMLLTAAALAVFDGSMKLSGIITFSICLGIAVDDTTHVLARYRREWAAGHAVPVALQRTMRGVGLPMVTTTLVFFGGFGTLALSALPGLREFGMLSLVAMISALIGDLILLPALLALGSKAKVPPPDEELEAG